MSLDSMYQEIILEHYKSPQGKGLKGDFVAEVHHVNPTCGDEITLRAHHRSDGTVDISYDNQGCSISQASASVMYELVQGKSIADAFAREAEFLELMQSKGQGVGNEETLGDAVAFAGVSQFPARVKCALLGWMAMKDAVTQTMGVSHD